MGTVYRHFPSLDELVPACGALSREIVGLPDAAAAEAAFEGVEDRVARLVREVFAIYARGAPDLRVVQREPDVHPVLRHAADVFEATLGRLIEAAALPGDRRIIRGLLDLGTWDALRRQGLTTEEAVEAVAGLLRERSAAQ